MGRSGGARRSAIVVLSVLAAAGCTSVSGTAVPSGGSSSSGPSSTQTTRLLTAMQRIDPTAMGGPVQFEFGDTRAIAGLGGGSEVRQSLAGVGGQDVGVHAEQAKQVLGIDVAGSDMMLSAGVPPAELTLVIGGQSAAAITAAAGKSGWTGSGTLTHPATLSDPDVELMLIATQIRPAGPDVAFGERYVDLGRVDDGHGLAEQPGAAALAGCLGEVVAALAAPVQPPRAAPAAPSTSPATVALVHDAAGGVRATAGSAAITSVLCLTTSTSQDAERLAAAMRSALATGSSTRSVQKWSGLLPRAKVEVLTGTVPTVRVTADTTGKPADRVLSMLITSDLPGIG